MKAKFAGQHELNPMLVGKTLAAVSGIFYLACAGVFAVAPDFAMSLFVNVFHGIDISKIASGPVSLGNTIVGFVEILIYAYLAGWLFAKVYNYKLGKMK